MRRYLRAKSAPVVLLLSNTRNCLHLETSVPLPDPVHTCASGCLLLLNRTACESLGPEPYPEKASKSLEKERSQLVDALASHYQMPHLDLHRLMVGMLAGGLTDENRPLSRLKATSKWQLVNRLYTDTVHFQACVGLTWEGANSIRDPAVYDSCPSDRDGPLLVADLLVSWLVKVQNVTDGGGSKGGATGSLSDPPAPYQVPAPLHFKKDQLYLMRCFGFSFLQILAQKRGKVASGEGAEAIDDQGGGGNGPAVAPVAAAPDDASASEDRKRAAKEAQARLGQVRPGDFFSTTNQHSTFQPLPPLNVTRVQGWTFQRESVPFAIVSYHSGRELGN